MQSEQIQPSNHVLPILAALLGVGLFFFGATIHLWLFEYQEGRIWGDRWDGFFNIWILRHVYESLISGSFHNLADARIFWPQNTWTFFWSDILLIPSIPFSLFSLMGASPPKAFWLTGLLLSFLFFFAFFFLFYQLYLLAKAHLGPPPTYAIFLVPFFSYLAFFSPGLLLNYFLHFQNLSGLWLFYLFGAMVAYQRNPTRWPILLIAFCLTALMCSSPYFAIFGLICSMIWFIFQVFLAPRLLYRIIFRCILFLVPLIFIFAIISWSYVQTTHVVHPLQHIKGLSVNIIAFFIPSNGLLKDLLNLIGLSLPSSPRAVAYPGIGLLVGFGGIVIWGTWQSINKWRTVAGSWLFWLFLVSLVATQFDLHGGAVFFAWYGLFIWAAVFLWAIWLPLQRHFAS